MRGALAIARRDFSSFFSLPIGWVVIALHLALSGTVFAIGALRPGDEASMRLFFALSNWTLIFVAPAISMRLIAEEQRTGSIDPLMTAPVSEWAIVAGKQAAAMGFLTVMLAPTLLYVAVLGSLSEPDYGAVALGYLGLLLLGGFYLAIGLLFSALTSNQIVAFLGTVFFVLLLQMATGRGALMIGPPLDRFLLAFSVELRLADFGKGVLDTAHVAFFIAGAAWFLVAAVIALQSRRWR
ncbi:MAG: hypothetical protein IBJ10_11270 [Phycisphaerales bacterium]|nr:hypothetical protein [Phycisphaerales bacterium]